MTVGSINIIGRDQAFCISNLDSNDLKWEISKELIFFKGAFIEDKGLGLSVHYRMLNAKDESIFEIFIERITKEFTSKKEIRVVTGKKVFEIRSPIEWDKGKAVLWLLKHMKLP